MSRRTGSVKKGIVAPDMLAERAKLAFDQAEMRTFLHSGKEDENNYKEMIDMFGADEGLRNHLEFYDMTPGEMQEDLWKRINVLYTKHKDKCFKQALIGEPFTDWIAYFQGLMPGVGLTISMFRMSVENLANEEQKARWMPKIQNLDILGCYAQTEIGHGSNVASLETTATLDKATDEFVINTPSITAAKYWPGDLGRFSSHAIVFARMLVGDNDYGVQPFMVQIRDPETWKRMPGIKCGDLGPKIGYQSKDNGWAMFEQVRIPRTDMLMGLCDLTKEGEMSVKGDPRVLYSVMMSIRMMIVSGVGLSSLNATKIAMRYCTMRRQFSTQQGTREERQVIDYQTTSFTLAKLLARGYLMMISGVWVKQEFQRMMHDIRNQKFNRLDMMHHVLSGFKVTHSAQTLADIETARRTCGGAGYQSNSGFTSLFAAMSPIPTYEGENTVMLGQSSRYLVKQIKRAGEGKKLAFPFEYLGRMSQTLATRNAARTVDDFLNLDVLDQAMQVRACNLIQTTMHDYNESKLPTKMKDNETFYQAKNNMTMAHLKYLQLHLFRTNCKEAQFKDNRNMHLLELIAKVYCLEQLLEDGAAVFDTGFFAPGSYRTMQKAMEQCVAELRPQFISLVEVPYMPDHFVPSVIGNEYGDIYEQQLEMAQKSRLNAREVPEYFERLMKPVLRAKL